MDPKIREAIAAAVSEADQSERLAHKISRWFDAIASTNEDVSDMQAAYRRLEFIYKEVESRKMEKLVQSLSPHQFIPESPDEEESLVQEKSPRMLATMRILGWKAEGLRCPDHEIDCRNEQGKPAKISLIQMPNGTGKTTTLTLLRAALSGVATNWDRKQVKELRKKNDERDKGVFQLQLEHNAKRITIIMTFDFESGQVQYKTTHGSGQEEIFDPPDGLRRFMNDKFVNFYVFDGELAEHLLSHDHTHAEEAVQSLFQIYLLSLMKTKVSEYWEKKAHSMANGDKAYTRRKNLLKKWNKRYEHLKKQKINSENQLSEMRKQLKNQEAKYKQEIQKEKDRARMIENAEDAVEDLKRRVHEDAKQLLNNMRDPQSLTPDFAKALLELKFGLDRVKLPESAAREFFEELADEDECVCGRIINDDIRIVIKRRAKKYLGSDDIALLNGMKSAITDAVGQSQSDAADKLSMDITALTNLVRKFQSAQNELAEHKLAAEQSDPEVMKVQQEIDRLQPICNDLQKAIQKFEDKDEKVSLDKINTVKPEHIFSIKTIEKGVQIMEEKVEEVTRIRGLRQTRDTITEIIKNARLKANQAIMAEIRDEANKRIAKIMPHNDIRIDEIKGCLKLREQSGGSAGETLSIAYAFLSTLFNRADQHNLPFVVDSPANPIDLDIRPQIGNLVPRLTSQFIAFLISSERNKFLPSLIKAGDGDTQFITLFRKGASNHEAKAIASPSCVNTKDGFLVMDEQFFNEFQLDAEET